MGTLQSRLKASILNILITASAALGIISAEFWWGTQFKIIFVALIHWSQWFRLTNSCRWAPNGKGKHIVLVNDGKQLNESAEEIHISWLGFIGLNGRRSHNTGSHDARSHSFLSCGTASIWSVKIWTDVCKRTLFDHGHIIDRPVINELSYVERWSFATLIAKVIYRFGCREEYSYQG